MINDFSCSWSFIIVYAIIPDCPRKRNFQFLTFPMDIVLWAVPAWKYLIIDDLYRRIVVRCISLNIAYKRKLSRGKSGSIYIDVWFTAASDCCGRRYIGYWTIINHTPISLYILTNAKLISINIGSTSVLKEVVRVKWIW